MEGLAAAVAETLARPEHVVQSMSDDQAHLYYRYYQETRVGDKWLCVVVKVQGTDTFILTAYLTDRMKKGTALWNAR